MRAMLWRKESTAVLAWMTVEDVQPHPGFQRFRAARKAVPCSASGAR
jgi:hypothetical protein